MGVEVDRARALVDDYWEGLIEADPLPRSDRLPDPSEAGRSNREAMQDRKSVV